MQVLNLSLVPPALQPLCVSAVNVGWKTTLSLLNAMQEATTQEAILRRRDSDVGRQDSEAMQQLLADNRRLGEELDQSKQQLVVVWEENEGLWQRLGTQAAEAERVRMEAERVRDRLLQRQREMLRILETGRPDEEDVILVEATSTTTAVGRALELASSWLSRVSGPPSS